MQRGWEEEDEEEEEKTQEALGGWALRLLFARWMAIR